MVVKLSLAVGVLLVGISSCYYFMFALPRIQNQRLAVELNSAKWEREQQCSARAEHFFNESSWSEKNSGAWYENHFNHKMNKCLILVQSNSSMGTSLLRDKTLLDVNDGKALALWGKTVSLGVHDSMVKPILCKLLDKDCQTDEEFDAFVKSYMDGF